MKLTILGLLQCIGLSLGIALTASVAPDFSELDYWTRVWIGASGVVVLLGALTARDWIAKLGNKR